MSKSLMPCPACGEPIGQAPDRQTLRRLGVVMWRKPEGHLDYTCAFRHKKLHCWHETKVKAECFHGVHVACRALDYALSSDTHTRRLMGDEVEMLASWVVGLMTRGDA